MDILGETEKKRRELMEEKKSREKETEWIRKRVKKKNSEDDIGKRK